MDFLSILASLLTIAMPLIGVIHKKYSKQKPLPSYARLSQSSIKSGNLIEKLLITYDGIEVENITVTTLTFWNNGHKKIVKNDFPSEKPPVIRTRKDTNVKILSCEVLDVYDNDFVKLNVNNQCNNNFCQFTFDTIGYNQGMVFRIVHTGINNNDIDLEIKLNDMRLKKIAIFGISRKDVITKICTILGALMAVLFCLFLTLYSITLSDTTSALVFCLSFLASIFLFINTLKLSFFPLQALPKTFRKYYYHITGES